MNAAKFETFSDIFSFFSLIVTGFVLAVFLLFMNKTQAVTIKSTPFGNNGVKIEYIESLADLEGGSPAKSENLVQETAVAPKIEPIPQKLAPVQKVASKPVVQEKVQPKPAVQKAPQKTTTPSSKTSVPSSNTTNSSPTAKSLNGSGNGAGFGKGNAVGNGVGTKQVGTSGASSSQNLSQNKTFIDNFLNITQASLQYPPNARKANIQGVVNVRVVFDRSGKIVSSSLVDNKQPAVLGKAALATINKVKSKWAPNLQLTSEQTITIPIVFKLK